VRFFFTMPAVWWTLECDKTKQSGNDGKPRNEIMAPTFGLRTHARGVNFSSHRGSNACVVPQCCALLYSIFLLHRNGV
jgi:hypothetical protein